MKTDNLTFKSLENNDIFKLIEITRESQFIHQLVSYL